MGDTDRNSSGKGGRRSSLLNENEGHQVHATIDLSPFSNATFHHLYPQHFPSYETNSAYGYYAPNSTNVYHPAGTEGWTEYLSRLNKQPTYQTTQTEAHGTTYEDSSSSYFPTRSVDSYIQPISYTQTSQQYSSQPTSDQYTTEDGQYYSYTTNRTHTSSYGLPSYPQHFLPLDPYAQIFPPSVVSGSEAKLKEPKTVPEQTDTAYSPGLYRVTDSFSQLSFPSESTPSGAQQNGTFREPPASIPQAAPAAPVTVAEPETTTTTPTYTEPVVETKKPRSYADALTRPRTATKPAAPASRAKPTGAPSTKPKNGTLPPSKAPAKKSTGSGARSPPTRAPPQQAGFKTQNTTVQVRRRPPNPLAKKLEVNPENFDTNISFARFFVIKSYSADDVHKSIKYGVWTSTKHGNKRLDQAFTESHQKGPIFLFFSVNGSGCFCGMAEMTSNLDYDKTFSAWSQDDKWSGQFMVKWIYIKNIPNKRLRHIRLVNNNNKSVTNSRDTQEVFLEPGRQVLKVFHTFEHSFSILDDFEHFDRLEESKKPKGTTTSSTTSTTAETSDTAESTTTSEVLNTDTEQFDVTDETPAPEKKSPPTTDSGSSTRGGGGRGRRGGAGSSSSSSGRKDTSTKDGGRSGGTYVPTSRGRGGGGRGGTTFAVKAKPKPTSLPS